MELFMLGRNTWNYLTVCKQIIIIKLEKLLETI